LAPKVSCIVLRSASKITAPVLEAGARGNLRLIVRVGAGVNNIDLTSATKNGVVVCNTPGTNSRGVVELTVAALLAMARNFVEGNDSLKAGRWDKSKLKGSELRGKTLGVIGLGNIGRGVAAIARAMEMRVLGFDPIITDEMARELGIELVEIEKLYAESDYISLHASLTDKSRNMIDAEAIAAMKEGVAIANCARAQLVDEAAMLEALDTGKVKFYYTDVFAKEPPDADNALVAHPRVLVTPHLGGSTEEAGVLGAKQAAAEISAFFKEDKVINSVNFFPGDPALAPWEGVAEKMGDFAYQYLSGTHKISQIALRFNGALSERSPDSLTSAFLKGFMQNAFENVNMINAKHIAREQGLKVVESKMENIRDYVRAAFTTDRGEVIFRGSQLNLKEVLHSIDDYFFDMALKDKHYLVSRHSDVPGIVGIIGTNLGDAAVNIEKFSLEDKTDRPSMAIISTSEEVPDDVVDSIKAAVKGKGGSITIKRIVLHAEPTVD
ncbi:MAG: phosphoglycerate dehydrogenase, partial [Planctomycetes bacterium]|nr:phosphoglycerate dehydrogenase [Planctomycetota bacterium]